MLLLVFTHWHMRGLIQQHVGSLKNRVGKQAHAGALAVFTALVLELRHAVQPAHPRRAVEQPLQLCVVGNLCLIEQHAFLRIDSASDQRRGHFQRCPL